MMLRKFMIVNNQQNIKPICLWAFTADKYVRPRLNEALHSLLPAGIIGMIVNSCKSPYVFREEEYRKMHPELISQLGFVPVDENLAEEEFQGPCPYFLGKRKIETHVAIDIPYLSKELVPSFDARELLKQIGEEPWAKLYPGDDGCYMVAACCFIMPIDPVPNMMRVKLLEIWDENSKQKLGGIPLVIHLVLAMITTKRVHPQKRMQTAVAKTTCSYLIGFKKDRPFIDPINRPGMPGFPRLPELIDGQDKTYRALAMTPVKVLVEHGDRKAINPYVKEGS